MRNDAWRKSTFSGMAECVELSRDGDDAHIRDSKDPGGAILRCSPATLGTFLHGVRLGDLDA